MPSFFSVCLLFFSVFSFFSPATTSADIYKYTDSHGVVSMTDNLDSVPAKYRSRMTVIKEASAKKKDSAPEPAQQQPPAAEVVPEQPKAAQSDLAPVRKFQELSATYPWLRPVSYLAVALAAFLVVNKISSLLPSRLLGRVISFAFTAAVVGFLFKSYSEHIANTAHKVKEEAAAIVKKSQARQESLPAEHDSSSKATEGAAVR